MYFDRATLITPERREFNPKELLSFAYWRDEHRQPSGLHVSINKTPAKCGRFIYLVSVSSLSNICAFSLFKALSVISIAG